MYRVSDESGTMKTTLVSEGKLSKTFLDSKDGEHNTASPVNILMNIVSLYC